MVGNNIIITVITPTLLQGRNQTTTIVMRVTLMIAESRRMGMSNRSISRRIQRVKYKFR